MGTFLSHRFVYEHFKHHFTYREGESKKGATAARPCEESSNLAEVCECPVDLSADSESGGDMSGEAQRRRNTGDYSP